MKTQFNKKVIPAFILIFVCITILIPMRTSGLRITNSIRFSQSLDDEIKKIVKKGKIPSVQIALISDAKKISVKTYGQDSAEKQLYQIGSVKKTIGATAVLQLHERGLININDDINKYIPLNVRNPQFPDVPVTIKMLLSHRSGLHIFRHQYDWDMRKFDYRKNDSTNNSVLLTYSWDKFLKESLDTTGINYDTTVWEFKPGAGFHYSNSAYLILEYLVEQVTGRSYEQFVHKNIFKPLEMNNTIFIYEDSTGSLLPAYTRNGEENIELPFREGMYSNAEDMAKFMLMHQNHGKYEDKIILKPETIDLMHKKHSQRRTELYPSGDCPFPGFGLGIMFYGDEWYGHGGSTVGYQTYWSFNKSNKKGYIILANVNGLCHGRVNFDSVWRTISSVEKLVKSEPEKFAKSE